MVEEGSLVEVDEGFVHAHIAAGGGVVAREVPVAGGGGTGFVETFEALEDEDDFGLHAFGAEHFGHLVRNLVGCEGGVDFAHEVGDLLLGQVFLGLALVVDFL